MKRDQAAAGTTERNAKRKLMPGWSVVAQQPLYKLKRQLPACKRVNTTMTLIDGNGVYGPAGTHGENSR